MLASARGVALEMWKAMHKFYQEVMLFRPWYRILAYKLLESFCNRFHLTIFLVKYCFQKKKLVIVIQWVLYIIFSSCSES